MATGSPETSAKVVGSTSWQLKIGLFLLPAIVYGVMMLGCKFPVQERVTAGVSYNDMLKEFAAHHKLEYRIMTVTKDESKKVYEEYKVKGIPQVVLIDRKGIVRMIKVGNTEENAKAVEEKIKELIEEK